MPPELQGWGPDFYDAFRSGEEQAFDRVFRAYHGPLTFFAFRYVHDEKLAEDIVQDCFVELWERRKKLLEVRSINSYLYRCVYNHCARMIENQKRKAQVACTPQGPHEPPVLESEILFRILQVIEHLPPRLKQVLRMYYLEEKSLKEIGTELGIGSESARVYRYEAIQLIRKTFITS